MESNKQQASDEIDISQLFHWIGNGFKNFGNSILKGIAGLRNVFIVNRVLFSVAIAIGLALGVIYSFAIRKNSYKTSMIVSSEYMNLQILQNTVVKLNLLCKEKDRVGLSEALNIDVATAKNIIEFDVENFVSEDDRLEMMKLKEQLSTTLQDKKDLIETVMKKLELNNQFSYKITVKIYDPEIVKPLETAIVNFLRNNEYVKKRIESNESILQERKTKLLRESAKLDSLKAVIYENFQTMAKQPREGSNNVILSDKYLADPMSVYYADMGFNEEIQEINKELRVKPYFELVDGLTTFREPASFGLVQILVFAFLGSVVFVYIALGLWKFNQYLAKLSREA